MEGWIKLHRSFLEHWLCDEYRPLTKREAWETMLFTVNYEDKKVLINGQLLDCKRGQSLLSLENWSKKFVWSIGATRHFFDLLKKDKMILTEGLKNTTRLTICNYDKYQDKKQANNKLTTSSQHSDNILTTTTKESKEDKESKEIKDIYDFDLFWIDYDKKVGSKTKLIAKWNKLTDEEKLKIKNYIPIYKKSQPDNKYRKNIETFLNNKSWNDEIIGLKNIDFKIKNVNIDDNYLIAGLK